MHIILFSLRKVGLGHYTLSQLKKIQKHRSLIGDVHGLGLFLGVELVKDRITKKRAINEAEAVLYTALLQRIEFQNHLG